MSKIVTANTLATGRVVFLGADGGWVEAMDKARLFEEDAAADEALEAANVDVARALVVEPFIADAAATRGGRPKMTLRDTIRAYGPTIDFLRPAQNKSCKNA